MTPMMDLIAKNYGSAEAMPRGKRITYGGKEWHYFASVSRMDETTARTDEERERLWKVQLAWPTNEHPDDEDTSRMCSCPWRFEAHTHKTGYFASLAEVQPWFDDAVDMLRNRKRVPALPAAMKD